MVWVNVDKPTKKYTIHAARTCTYVLKMAPTPFKGVEELRRDGEWLSFTDVANALARYQKQYANYTLIEHC